MSAHQESFNSGDITIKLLESFGKEETSVFLQFYKGGKMFFAFKYVEEYSEWRNKTYPLLIKAIKKDIVAVYDYHKRYLFEEKSETLPEI